MKLKEAKILVELIEILSYDDKDKCDDYCQFYVKYIEPKEFHIIELGKELNKIGGFELMELVFNNCCDGYTANLLHYLWHGIGEWYCHSRCVCIGHL